MKINAIWDLWLGKKEPANQKPKTLAKKDTPG